MLEQIVFGNALNTWKFRSFREGLDRMIEPDNQVNAPPLSLLQSFALKQKAKMDYCLLDRFNHIRTPT